MNLLKLRKYWLLTCSFIKAHWRGLVVGAAMLFCFFYGKKVEKRMKLDRAMALAQWDKDKKEIERSYEDEMAKKVLAKEKYDAAMLKAEEDRKNATDEFDRVKAAELKKMIKKAKSDPDEIDRILEDSLGIKKV